MFIYLYTQAKDNYLKRNVYFDTILFTTMIFSTCMAIFFLIGFMTVPDEKSFIKSVIYAISTFSLIIYFVLTKIKNNKINEIISVLGFHPDKPILIKDFLTEITYHFYKEHPIAAKNYLINEIAHNFGSQEIKIKELFISHKFLKLLTFLQKHDNILQKYEKVSSFNNLSNKGANYG